MRYLGAHMSISGGLEKAVERIKAIEGTALQIFSKNQRQWHSSALTDEQILAFTAARKCWGDYPVAIHNSYLINLATPKADGAEKSVFAFADELRRAELLNIPYIVTHPGAHLGVGEELGIKNVALRLEAAIALSETTRVMVLLENTAGQGSALGYRFSQLGRIIAQCPLAERVAVCLDTAHAFEAGYNWCSQEGYKEAFAEFEQEVGLDKLLFMHMNDSKTELGSRVDRHAHIGEGYIGLEGFSRIMLDERVERIPMVLETPKESEGSTDGLEYDRKNLRVLRELVAFSG